MPDDRLIPYLLQRYLDDQLTEAELSQLADLLRDQADDEAWAVHLQGLGMLQERDLTYEEARWKPVLEAILQRRNDGLKESEGLSGEGGADDGGAVVRRMRGLRWAAAAAVLLIIGAGGMYWYQHTRHGIAGQEQTAYPLADLKPGGNKAVLTLGNGQQIVLDSAANGVLADEGSSQVQKLHSGALSYMANKMANKMAGKMASAAVLYNTLTTPRGGQYQLQLPDGSKVWLDAASSLTYPTAFTGGVRRVKLSGQAYFEVEHDAAQPFVVEVNGTEVKDLGTTFNINAYDDEPMARVTLITGGVAIGKKGVKAAVLQPGQQARIGNASVALVSGVDVDQVVAWKNGQFQFDNASTAEVMRQVARWYNVTVSYEGDVQNKRFSGGVPRKANASELLHVLELTKSVQFTIEGDKIIVQPYQGER